MKKYLLMCFLVLMTVAFINTAYGKRIELTDGSTIDGEIVSFSGGKYTVKSSSLGTLQIEDSKVRSISNGKQPVAGSSEKSALPIDSAAIQNGMQKLQRAIADNPEIMRTVTGLVSNSNAQALPNASEVMSTAKTLLANQNLSNAVNDPTIKEISQKIKES